MKELQEIANQAIEKYLNSGDIEKTIEEQIAKNLRSAIESAFQWGKLNKTIKEIVENKLELSFYDVDLHSYNAIMLEALKGQITQFTNEEALAGFNKVLSETFGEAPQEISINDVVEKILESWRSDDPFDCDKKAAEITYEKHDYPLNGSYSLEISDGERYSEDKFSLYFLDNKLRISHKSALNPTTLRGIEGYLFKLYAAGTTIKGLDEFAPDDIDLDLSYPHD